MRTRSNFFLIQTLAIRFATVDNAEAFKAAFFEARQYVLENQVGLAQKSRPSSLDLTMYTGEEDPRRGARRS